MTAGNHIWTVQWGDELLFHISARTIIGGDDTAFDPSHYDVYRISTNSAVSTDQSLTTLTNNPEVWIPSSPITLNSASYVEGEDYVIICKNGTGDSPTVYKTLQFHIDKQYQIDDDTQYILRTEATDATLTGTDTLDDTLLGRLMTLERNQQNIIFPRLKRLLGLAGEHQVVDGFLYDDAGNVTSARVRIFETQDEAIAAARWTDAVNDTDPAPSLSTGEICRYDLAVTHLLPRNLRTLYRQSINTDQDDNDYVVQGDGSWM